jgi:hypothetical protein
MSRMTVNIEDRIRDRHEYVPVDVDVPVEAVVEELVGRWGLPRRNFLLDKIHYSLVRQRDDSVLPDHVTLRELGIGEDDSCGLVGEEGKRVWDAVQRLLDEIESEIKDRVKEEVRERIEKQLEEIARTEIRPRDVEQLQHQLADSGGPPWLAEQPQPARTPGRRSGQRRPFLRRILTTLTVFVVVVVVIVVIVPDDDESPEARIVGAELLDIEQVENGCVAVFEFFGDGTDPEDGELPDDVFEWRSDRHDSVVLIGRAGTARLFSPVGEPVTHIMTLEVHDSDGNKGSDSIRVETPDC